MREDPRIARTRKLIRDALSALLEQQAFSDISVQDIAEVATINRATFYAHFRDKHALLEDLIRSRYRADLSQHDVRADQPADVSVLLETIALTTFEHVHSLKNCKVDKEFEPQLERAMQNELYELLLPALGDSASLVVSSAIIGSTLQWRAGRYEEPAEELVQRFVGVLARGVRMQRSLEAVS
jgi:AcrR family transcriptional regulator